MHCTIVGRRKWRVNDVILSCAGGMGAKKPSLRSAFASSVRELGPPDVRMLCSQLAVTVSFVCTAFNRAVEQRTLAGSGAAKPSKTPTGSTNSSAKGVAAVPVPAMSPAELLHSLNLGNRFARNSVKGSAE
jgi:hypothetical protein